jgi:hypothetical protein
VIDLDPPDLLDRQRLIAGTSATGPTCWPTSPTSTAGAPTSATSTFARRA